MDTTKLSVKARQVHNFRGRDQRPKARQCTHEVTRKNLTRVLRHFRCRSYLIIAHIQWESTTRSWNKEEVYCRTSYNGLFQFLVPPGLKIYVGKKHSWGLPRVWLTCHVSGSLGREDVHHGEEVPSGVQAGRRHRRSTG
jgi:hypothetical protein